MAGLLSGFFAQPGGGLLSAGDFKTRLPHILGAAGAALGQVSQGRPVNLDRNYDRMKQDEQRRDMEEALQNPELMAGMTPQQQAVLRSLSPEQAMALIAQQRFQKQDAPDPYDQYKVVGGRLVDMAAPGGPSVVVDQGDPRGSSITMPDGTVIDLNGGSGMGNVKLTEGQSKDVNFATRMQDANRRLDEFEKAGYDPTNARDYIAQNAGVAGNFIQSEMGQLYESAQRNFLAAVLRKDTGAAVTKEEWAFYRPMFFAEPGESAQAVAAKTQARAVALDAMKRGMGLDAIRSLVGAPDGAPGSGPSQEEIEAEMKRRGLL